MPRRHLLGADCAAGAFALVISAVVVLGLAAPARAAFTGGPSVRVTPNTKVEIRWTANFVGDGRVETFDNPNGGVFVDVNTSSAPAAGHTINFFVGGIHQADETYFFRVIHKDPTNVRPDLTNDPPPYPPFFTGVQAIGSVSAQPGTHSALISWDANVIGMGRVDFGLTTPGDVGTLSDSLNVTDHSIELTGLQPQTTYVYRVSNLHAIDGDALALRPELRSAEVLSFTTLPEPSGSAATAAGAILLARRRRRSGEAAA